MISSLLTCLSKPDIRCKLLWLLIVTTLITVSIIIIPYVPTASPAVQSKMLALRMLLAFVLVLAIINLPQLRQSGWRLADTIFAALLVSFGCSLLGSGRIFYCLAEAWHLGGFVCLAWIVYRLRPSYGECSALIRICGMLGLVAALYGFLAYIGYDILKPLYPFDFEKEQGGGRNFIHSFYGNPEYFGGFAAPTAVVLLGLGLQPAIKLWHRAAWIVGAGFVMAVLALSGSRGAFLGCLVGGAIVFLGQIGFLSRRMRKMCWFTSALTMLAVLLGLVILSTPNPLNPRDMRLLQRFKDIANTQSASIRERILFYTSTAMAIPINPVFGYGPGTYRLEFFNNVKLLVKNDDRAGTVILLTELNRRLAEHTHNDFLEIWFEQGTVGIALLLLLITHASVRFAMTRWQVRRAHQSTENLALPCALAVTVFAAVTTIMVNALTSFPLHMPARGTLAWILIGVYFSVDSLTNEALDYRSGNKRSLPLQES